jgi:ketosteroid isomerase-like protein
LTNTRPGIAIEEVRLRHYILVAAAGLYIASGSIHASLTAQTLSPTHEEGRLVVRTTQEVLDHHLKVFGAGDLEGTLSDYAPTAILFTPNGVLKGHQAMSLAFKAFFAEFSKPGVKFEMKSQSVEGNYAYILWTADTPDNIYELGQDAFVIKNGKIVAQFYTARVTPKHK